MQNQYTDIYGKTHYIKKELKRGGQGVVYKTQDPNILVKIELNPDGSEVKEPNKIYDDIRILPLPKGINLTLPLAPLKNVSGYVMYLLDDMVPFSKYFSDTEKVNVELENNQYLLQFKDNENLQFFVQNMAQYISTGANKVRLEAFFKLACILSQLHANGLVYGDISENNIFIANFDNNVIVWLIDSDNLNFQRITSKKIFGTPGYYAPELINPDISKRKGNTFYSDSYSFSIALFTQLTGKYPFMGSFFEEHSEEFEYEEDKEEMAFSGTLPWILDEEDKSNESDTVPPSDLVISKDIRNLFRRTFSKKGRAFRETRPSMVEWAYFLGKEVDNTVVCSLCHMGYNALYNNECPYCDKKNLSLNVKSYKNESKIWSYTRELRLNNTYKIPLRCVEGLNVREIDKFIFSYKYDGAKIIFTSLIDDFDIYRYENEEWRYCYGEFCIEKTGKIKCSKKNVSHYEFILEVTII